MPAIDLTPDDARLIIRYLGLAKADRMDRMHAELLIDRLTATYAQEA